MKNWRRKRMKRRRRSKTRNYSRERDRHGGKITDL